MVLARPRLLIILLMSVLLTAQADELVTQDGGKILGSVLDISERGVVVQTDEGVKKIDPMEIESLTLDRLWSLAFADGTLKTGHLHVKDGDWYFEDEPLNFYSVYAYTPKSKVVDSSGYHTAPSPEVEPKEGSSGEAPPLAQTEANGAAAGQPQPLGPQADSPAPTIPGQQPSSSGFDLPSGEVQAASPSPIRGEVLAITPQYLLIDTNGAVARFSWRRVQAFTTDSPWTVVDLDGERYTGRLRFENGQWRVEEHPLDPESVAAFIPRLDLQKTRVPKPAPKPAQPAGGSAPESAASKPQARSDASPAAPKAGACPKPDELAAPAQVDVSGWSAAAALKTAGDFANAGNLAEAVRIYRTALERNPQQAEAWLRLGGVYRNIALACEAGQSQELATHYFKEAARAYAEAETRAGSRQDLKRNASYWHEHALRESRWGSRAVSAHERAYAAFQAGDYAQAEQAFATASEANPNWPDPYYWRARALLKLHHNEEAVPLLKTALELDPSNELAQELLLQLGELPPKASLDLLLKAAYQHENAGRSETAEKIYAEALRRFPDSFEGHYRYGLLERKLGHWEQAQAELQQARQLASGEQAKKVSYWLKRLDRDRAYGIAAVDAYEQGYAQYTSGQYQEAARSFGEAARLAPQWSDAVYWWARALVKLGKLAEAKQLLRDLLQKNPDHQGAAQLLQSLS